MLLCDITKGPFLENVCFSSHFLKNGLQNQEEENIFTDRALSPSIGKANFGSDGT